MTIYKAPLDDQRFALFDVLGAEAVLTKLQGGDGHTRDLLDAVLRWHSRDELVLASGQPHVEPVASLGLPVGIEAHTDHRHVGSGGGALGALEQVLGIGWQPAYPQAPQRALAKASLLPCPAIRAGTKTFSRAFSSGMR